MDKVNQYWDEFCKEANLQGSHYKEAFQFGEKADWLAELVVEGKKTATCSSYPLYQIEGESLPKVGEYFVILNSHNSPVAVIQIESVEIFPMNKVPEAFALAEGEGDYQEWWDVHQHFFTELLKEYKLEFSPDMLVVCERFKRL